MSQSKIRIAIIDDHQIVIDGLLSLLHGFHHLSVVITTTDPRELLQLMSANPVDILLTDVMMPFMNGDELSKEVKTRFPQVKIMALSMSGQLGMVTRMIEDADISGYVLKNIGKQELVEALEKIAGGGIYFSEEILLELNKTVDRKKQNAESHLTDREVEIIRLIENEFSNKKIAEALYISERTVETHRKNIFRKTGTNNVIGLIKYAYEHKLV
jgi:two-component system, NarL family, nitrate/nitrite response regulator NarL